jgi:outer membrane protein OmpA-like peptidoglycan-associated protein
MKVSKLVTTILISGMLAGCVSHKYQVYFKPGSAELSADGRMTVKEAANMLNNHKHTSAKISGFTDGIGSSALNKDLAMKRISSVDNMLMKFGVDGGKLSANASGKRWLYHGEKNDDISQRRVEIRVYKW